MASYQTKDGILLKNVPDDVPEEQIKARIEKIRAERPGAQSQQDPIIQPTKGMSDYEKRAYDISRSDITVAEKAMQATNLGLEYIYDTAAQEISDFVAEKPKRYIGDVAKSLINAAQPILKTPTGQLGMLALKEGGEKMDEFEQDYPRIAADLKAAGGIAGTALFGIRPAIKLTNKAFFGKHDYLKDIVTPSKIKDIDLKNVRTEGLRGKVVIDPSFDEKEMIKVLESVKGLGQRPTPARAYEYINTDLTNSAAKLRDQLAKSGTKVNDKEILLTLKKAATNFDRSYDKSKRMNVMQRKLFIEDALDRIGSPKTTAELLDARKMADKRFRFFSNDRRMKGELIPTRDEMKWRSTRDSLNAMLEMKEPGYKASIRKQHMLYRSMDVLDGKVRKQIEDESKSMIERHLPKVTSIIAPKIR